MMGGETFILLKAGLLGLKSGKQGETRMAFSPTILSTLSPKISANGKKIPVRGCIFGDFRCLWLIRPDSWISVIQITVLAGILTHNPAWEGRGKMTEIVFLNSIRSTTSESLVIQANGYSILGKPKRYFSTQRFLQIKSGMCASRSRSHTSSRWFRQRKTGDMQV